MAEEITVTVECDELIKEIVVRKADAGIASAVVNEGSCTATVALGRATEEQDAVWEHVSREWELQ